MLALMISCKGDDENDIINDSSALQIVFTSHEANDDVWNTITIKTEITEVDAVEKVAFFAGETPLGEVKTSPFNMALNTKNYDDGTVEIKAVAFDKVGNKSEKTISLNVQNTLLTFGASEYSLTKDFYVFLSDDNGNVIESKKIEDTNVVKFLRPEGFEDATFSLSTAELAIGTSGYIYTYTDIAYGLELGFESNVTSNSTKGDVLVKIDDLSNNYRTMITPISGGPKDIYSTCSPCSYLIELYTNPTNIYVSHEPMEGDPSYKFIQDVEVDQQIDLEIGKFLPLTKHHENIPSDFEGGQTFLFGLLSREDESHDSYLMNFKMLDDLSSGIQFFYPEGVFDGFYTWYTLNKGRKRYIYRASSETVSPFVKTTIDVNIISSSNNAIAATITGNHDFANSTWVASDEGFTTTSHKVYGEAREDMVALRPQIPEAILNDYPALAEENFSPYTVEASDFANIETYSEYINQTLLLSRSSSNSMGNEQSVTERLVITNEGGRFLKDEIDINRLLQKR